MANKVKMELVGLDGNAFSLMGAFSKAARRQGWTSAEIKVVTDECMSGDYDNLLFTLTKNIESPSESSSDADETEDNEEGCEGCGGNCDSCEYGDGCDCCDDCD